MYVPLPRSAPVADAKFLFEALVGLFHCLIGRAPFLNTLHTLGSRLPMTYRRLRTIALAFVTTLRKRAGQDDLQIRPRAIWRDKKLSTKGTDNDQSQQREYSKKIDRIAGSYLTIRSAPPSRPVRTGAPAFTNASQKYLKF